MRHTSFALGLVAAALLSAPARAQTPPPGPPPGGPSGTPDGSKPPQPPPSRQTQLTPIPSPKGAADRMPTPPRPHERPPVEEVDDPALALEIDGQKIDRATYGEALIEEQGLGFLETFVANYLVEKRAKELKIDVSAEAVEAAVNKNAQETLEKRFHGKQDMLETALKNAGLTVEQWHARTRHALHRDMVAAAVLKADRDLSDPVLRKEYESRFGAAGEHRVGRAILFSTQVITSNLYTQAEYDHEKPAIEAEAMARAATAVADLKAGADFATLAKERGDDPQAAQGGDYGRFWQNRFGPEAEAKIAKLGVGETSDPIQTPHGFVVARCTGVEEGWDFHARHILFSTDLQGMPSEEMKAKKLADARAAAQAAIAQLKAGADFAELAKKSDDPSNRDKGGDLGTFGAGKMVAPFEAALKTLAVEEISGPVETRFGVHVIQLIAKTRKPADDAKTIRAVLFSTDFVKVKEHRLRGPLDVKAHAAADDAAARLKAGEDAEAMARKLSEEPTTKEKGGLVEDPFPLFFGAGAKEAFLALAAPGDVTTVKTDRGYVAIKLEKLEKHTFEQERDAIAKELREKDPTPAETKAYKEKLRDAAVVKRGKM